MKLFECSACGQPLYFENTRCESCGRRLGYNPAAEDLSALEPVGDRWRPSVGAGELFRLCVNAEHDACNWLVPEEDSNGFCVACRHNRTVPDLGQEWNRVRWRRLERAKHRLFYTLLRLRLPLADRFRDPQGLAFHFLADPNEASSGGPAILTGHDNGLITINIAEADDAERERRRHAMREPYRTLLGHFRHEIGHYFWNVLVRDDPSIEAFRRVFGDEREDYAAALQRHYDRGPPPDWQERYVSAYASAHPWEDFAETWAHYLHIVDTLETASAFGLKVTPKIQRGPELSAEVDFDPHDVADLDRLIDAWLPLTFAVNSLNRSMGQPDLYPFVLSPSAIGKLGFVHERIYAAKGHSAEGAGGRMLKAVIGGLRARVAVPGTR
jgi:hypothetical protein